MKTRHALLCTTLTALAIALPGCDLGVETSRLDRSIIQGDPVTGDAFGAVVGITTNAGTICTGTLISPTTVMTAAHCVEPMLLKQAIQAAGQTPPDEITYQASFARDLRAAGETDMMDAESVEWHAEFLADIEKVLAPGVTQWNDIALVHLAAPVEGHPLQRLAPTDVVETIDADGMLAVAGYGETDDSDPTSAGVLTAGQSGLGEVGEFEILAGEGDTQQACRGDSGGPVFADDSDTYQIGIASRINAPLFPPPSEPPPCETGLLYTRVDSYHQWIADRVPDLDEDGGDTGGDTGGDEGDTDGHGGGGGCSLAGGQAGPGAGLALLLALAIAPRRRRRNAGSGPSGV